MCFFKSWESLYMEKEKEMATHFSILAWEIPWTEEPGGLQSMGSQRVRHNWATNTLDWLPQCNSSLCPIFTWLSSLGVCALSSFYKDTSHWMWELPYIKEDILISYYISETLFPNKIIFWGSEWIFLGGTIQPIAGPHHPFLCSIKAPKCWSIQNNSSLSFILGYKEKVGGKWSSPTWNIFMILREVVVTI